VVEVERGWFEIQSTGSEGRLRFAPWGLLAKGSSRKKLSSVSLVRPKPFFHPSSYLTLSPLFHSFHCLTSLRKMMCGMSGHSALFCTACSLITPWPPKPTQVRSL